MDDLQRLKELAARGVIFGRDHDAWYAAANPATITRLIARLEAAEAANAELRTVMVAAAEEIHEHWQAHCDAEGYGPANLMRRLEEGIPSQYGYTAGAFAELKAKAEAAEADARRYRWLRDTASSEQWVKLAWADSTPDPDAAIDAAMSQGE